MELGFHSTFFLFPTISNPKVRNNLNGLQLNSLAKRLLSFKTPLEMESCESGRE